MISINLLSTPTPKKAPPTRLPDVTRGEAQSWFSGWWHGIAVGAVCGVAVGVVLAGVI
jgi:hypothetical protein